MTQEQEHPKIAKWLAAHGIASRRKAEDAVREGRVTVNGKVMTDPAERIVPGKDIIAVDGETLESAAPEARIWRFHKPKGCITAASDPEGRKTIYDILPPECRQLRYIGRLDYNTEGLLLLTNSGAKVKELTDPQAGIKRVYRARCRGEADPARLAQVMRGATIGDTRYRPAVIKADISGGGAQWYTLELKEGKYREVRILLEYCGLQVARLIRTAYGKHKLGDLPEGAVSEITGGPVAPHKPFKAKITGNGKPEPRPRKSGGPPKKRAGKNAGTGGKKRHPQ